ncbi:MAG: UDP-N-acetylglucosamine 2-epimerase (non-hydrolyzing) [Chloroflexi bacterium]|nr:UDP-N-acetylglucosamine 2-epimerase (non-hydrolyzing) [Chloroflexota bacterium]
MKICLVLGTRPEIIKLSPVMRELVRRDADFFILHTGQHYSYNLDGIFFERLALPQPKYNLDVGSGSHAEETAKMLIGIEKVLLAEKPGIVLVQGDTNSVLAGALGAAKIGIKVGHVEAGLRSYDRRMPEEINRVLADHIADHLYAPTPKSREILLGEGIPEKRVFTTGNTVVDAVYQNREIALEKGTGLSTLKLNPKEYFLVTLHRQENVDNPSRLSSILSGLSRVAHEFCLPIIYPIHPRTRKRLKDFSLTASGLTIVEPLDYLSFLQLENHAKLILTDSGGVQEEACILGVPCVTLRDNTERYETLEAGANILAGSSPGKILESVRIMTGRDNSWANPFGDGNSGKRIVEIIEGGC